MYCVEVTLGGILFSIEFGDGCLGMLWTKGGDVFFKVLKRVLGYRLQCMCVVAVNGIIKGRPRVLW